ncbi:MAG: hypothetical protein IT173_11240 [Acidobacteria bacterium]|nr:hypothetical protein [Acidobacteriota bacterium]
MPKYQKKGERFLRAASPLIVLLGLNAPAMADCQVPEAGEFFRILARVSVNAYFSGAFLGGSIVLFLVSAIYYLFRTQSFLIPILTGILLALIAGVFFVLDLLFGAECSIAFGSNGPLPNALVLAITTLIAGVHFKMGSQMRRRRFPSSSG